MRHLLFALTTCAALLLAACDEGAGPPPASGDPTQVQYAPSLNVDLGAMSLSPTGLYTLDTVVGTGTEATAGRTVSAHYTGWLPNGTEFDTSRDSVRPFSFVLGQGQVIQGWDEGIAGMKVGGQRRLVIPASLGYGSRGVGMIPPHSVLIFDVELISVR